MGGAVRRFDPVRIGDIVHAGAASTTSSTFFLFRGTKCGINAIAHGDYNVTDAPGEAVTCLECIAKGDPDENRR
jgi:hypothetical protein